MNKTKLYCYGIVDKRNELYIEKYAFSGMKEAADGTAELLNEEAQSNTDERAPYQPVEIYLRKIK